MPQALFLASLWPEKTSSAAGYLLWKLIEAFQSRGIQITYGCSSQTDSKERFISELHDANVATRPIAPNDPSFDAWIADLRPHYVVFDRFTLEEQFGWRVRDHSSESMRILNTSDLHFLRRAREAKKDPLTSEDFSREIASILRSDLSLIVSDYELALLENEIGISPSLLSLYRPPYTRLACAPAFEERKNFAMIGNFMHPPNRDSVLWMKNDIWPLIREKIREAELHVYGAYPDKAMSELDSRETGLQIRGWTENAIETLSKYRVTLAPLRFGAGYKGKILDSFCAGTPCITTPIGAEGMGGIDPRVLVESSERLAERAVAAYENADLWMAFQTAAFAFVEKNFNARLNQPALLSKIDEVFSDLETHRRKNYFGSLLWHHTLRSTTYFSRWIELKNSIKSGTPVALP